jgi:hypothetical protein
MSTNVTETNSLGCQLEEMEMLRDMAALRLARIEQANDERFPLVLVKRLSDGEHPVRVWRDYRGLSVDELAKLAATTSAIVQAIEAGAQEGPLHTLAAIALALKLDLDDLVPWSQDDAPTA